MLDRMSGPELAGWQGYDRVFGLGDNLELMGMVCTLIARTMGGDRNAKPADFVPFFSSARPEQTPEEQAAAFGRIEARHHAGGL